MGTNDHYEEKQWTFKDGKKTIDYVLVWDGLNYKATRELAYHEREIFEENLKKEGLELEYDFVESSGLHAVKIHCPLDTLQCYAEILKLQMPLKDELTTDAHEWHKRKKSCFEMICPCFNFMKVNSKVFPPCDQQLTFYYSRARDYLFNADSLEAFTPGQKGRVIQFILERTLYSKDKKSDVYQFGINRLLLYGVYSAAYSLHDGHCKEEGKLRKKFYRHWSSMTHWYKYQPADYLRQYFGVRTALYFMWLGYYTTMLLPASIAGFVCFILSIRLVTISEAVQEVCSGKIKDYLCPKCDHDCSFKKVSDSCLRMKILTLFDNGYTVAFAIFMSFWAAVFLECWKRYSAEITFRWDLTSLDNRDENPRPEYAATLSKLIAHGKADEHTMNLITNAMEPKINFWRYIFPGRVLSITAMILLVSMAIASVIGVTLYNIIAMSLLPYGMLTSATGTFLNLMCILIFSPIYSKLSAILTDLEMPRTKMEFDSSLTIKMYLLEFINNYSSIFYIAFFKGKFIGPPSGYYRIFGHRQPECGVGDCMVELTQQLAIIMIGKRAFRSIFHFFKPIISSELKKRYSNSGEEESHQWEKDYELKEMQNPLLLNEYIDMVLQYGFVTIFVSAFPLAPLFALINNIFEIRIDARKFLVYHRRPTMRRTKDIGVWYGILNHVSQLAIFTNAFIISFTSNFIPRLVYTVTTSSDHGTVGFINSTLSYIDIKDLDMRDIPHTKLEYCRYTGYREPPWSKDKYEETKFFWIVLAARLLFFIIFENLIALAVVVVKWIIPDIPQHTMWQMRRRHFLINEIIIKHEDKETQEKIKRVGTNKNKTGQKSKSISEGKRSI